jgi:hypothetical protein
MMKTPFGHRVAFQQIYSSAAGDDAPTKTGNCRQGARHMSLIGNRISCVDVTDDVGGHGGLTAVSSTSGISQFVANRRAAATRSPLKKDRGRAGVLG